jgi:hypothetical protein
MKKTIHDWSRLDAMTEELCHSAALVDPDAQPLTDAHVDRMKLTPRLKISRRGLGFIRGQSRVTRSRWSVRCTRCRIRVDGVRNDAGA